MPKGIPLTEEEQANRRREIFNAAVNLFLEEGFQETSMREIAKAAGMGKSSLYDYFKTKDDILLFVFEEQLLHLIDSAKKIASQPAPVERRIKKIMEMNLEFFQANKSLFFRLSGEAQRLNATSQARIQQRRYEFQDTMRALIEEGISDGSFCEVNPLLAARLLINSIISILYTSRPTGDAKEMLDETVDIFFHGVKTDRRQQ
jgi:AcrR family transcriptional regulator